MAQTLDPPMTKKDTDALVCPECGKGAAGHPMVLSPACHQGAPALAIVFEGVVLILCMVCMEPVTSLQLKEEA